MISPEKNTVPKVARVGKVGVEEIAPPLGLSKTPPSPFAFISFGLGADGISGLTDWVSCSMGDSRVQLRLLTRRPQKLKASLPLHLGRNLGEEGFVFG